MQKKKLLQGWMLKVILLISFAPMVCFAFGGGESDPRDAFPAMGLKDSFGTQKTTVIQGQVQTYECALKNKACAAEPNDPVTMAAACFVVLLPDGEYYFIVNVDCRFLAGIATERVKVTGVKDPKYDAIIASTIELIRDGKTRLIFFRSSRFNPPPKP